MSQQIRFATLFVLTLGFIALAPACADDTPVDNELASQAVHAAGTECGGDTGLTCGAGEYCDVTANWLCGAPLAGVCKIVPSICTYEYAPVCGCDGVDYSNDCFRLIAQVQQAHRGECL